MNDLSVKNSLPVKSIAELEAIGTLFERSGMFGCTQQGQGLVLAMTCVMENKTPLEVVETYHIIDGRPSKRADAMLASLIELGGTYKILERSPTCAKIELKYKDASYVEAFTWEEAQKEPYVYQKDGKTLKKNWATPRARMQSLWARVTSDGVRVVCPLANRGNYTPEEIQDEIQPASVIISTSYESTKHPFIAAESFPVLEELVDPSIIPLGDQKGKPWSVLSIEQLKKCRGLKNKEITPDHIKAIDAELAKREEVNDGQ